MNPEELQQHLEQMWMRAVVEEMQGPLPDRFHGRWNMLSVEDVRFLIDVGIEID